MTKAYLTGYSYFDNTPPGSADLSNDLPPHAGDCRTRAVRSASARRRSADGYEREAKTESNGTVTNVAASIARATGDHSDQRQAAARVLRTTSLWLRSR